MKEQLTTLIKKLKDNSLTFKEVIEFIETYYQHHPTAFRNGEAHNEATQNQGSAKVFAFAQLNNLNGADHQNIRQFMIHGWPGIAFEGQALLAK